MKKYYYDYHEAKKNGNQKPQIPDYVGKAVMLIAKNLATKPQFAGYPFREEMEADRNRKLYSISS